jgi:membrane-associated phospholipid phosphatase
MTSAGGQERSRAVERRDPPRSRPLPVDVLVAAYNVVLAVVWLGLIGRTPHALLVAVGHLLAARLPWVLRRIQPRGWVRALREGYPLLGLAIFWGELGVVQRLRALPPHDEAIRALDLTLFRGHWSDVWMTRMPYPALQEIMFFSYFLYYLLLIVPPFAIGFAGGWKAFRSVVLAVMLTYLTCFLFYLVFPVYGPRAMTAAMSPSASEGFFQLLVERARASGDSLGTAFPSSHVAGAMTMAWLGWRWLGRRWGLLLAAAALAVALATVYTRNHYVVDAVAGALWVLPLQLWVMPRLERGSAEPAPSV